MTAAIAALATERPTLHRSMADPKPKPDFATQAAAPAKGGSNAGILVEFWHFLRTNKKWWLLPLIVVLLIVGLLVVLGGTAAAPFIYTLF